MSDYKAESSIELIDRRSIAIAKEPTKRVSLQDIKDNIAYTFYTTGGRIVARELAGQVPESARSLNVLTICLVVMKNGFTVIGKSAPASESNFDQELGKQLAYENAIHQLWPLMGFALREKLYAEG